MTAPGNNDREPDETGDRANAKQMQTDAEPDQFRKRTQDESDEDEFTLFMRDMAVSVLAVFLIGTYIFMISGVWPPMVAIESGSMAPNMEVNDLVFVMDTDRFQPSEAHEGTGVVTAEIGDETGYESYGGSGDVIVFAPQGNEEVTPVIHRAMFWVEEGENWYEHEQAEEEYLGGADSCDELVSCPAPHDGFITKGDANTDYDQAGQQFEPVKAEWVVGTAEVRVPRLGWLRLQFQ